jgi:hypothetical protein
MEAALIRRVIRLAFWCSAEERGLLLDPGPVAREAFLNRGTGPESLELPDEDLFAAVKSMDLDCRDLSGAGLGAAYTALLEGGERKATGSYYTPPDLVERLLDSALEPVLDQTRDRPEALLATTVCDPACGAGYFLDAADAWCAALVRPAGASPPTGAEIARLAAEHGFFHWHLEFPAVFAAGGFSCVLGNPPWERIKVAAKRRVEGESRFLRGSGRYPLTARGDINAYAVFAEAGRMLTGPRGRLGMIVPTGIATDLGPQRFFRDLVEEGGLISLYDFGNALSIFANVHRSYKFSLLTLAGRDIREPRADFAFFLHDAAELDDPGRRFTLTPEEITRLNPDTGTCPVFRTRRDAGITLGAYRRVPVLGHADAPWGITFTRMFDMSIDAGLVRRREELERDGWRLAGHVFTRGQDRMLPLYQGIMASFYDHRAADVARSRTAGPRQHRPRYLTPAEKDDPARSAMPAFWVDAGQARASQPGSCQPGTGSPGWQLGFSSVTSPTNERTFVPYLLPRAAVGNSTPLIRTGPAAAGEVTALVAMLSAFCFDYVARQKVGGVNLNYFIVRQLPVLPPPAVRPFGAFARPGSWS